MNIITHSDQETKDFGKRLARGEDTSPLRGGDVVCLYGELGAGKTTLVKGIAQGLGVKEEITSPTFTLMNIYNIEDKILNIKYLVHIDTYRLKNEQELLDIGVEDYLGAQETVTIVEWPEKIENLLKDKNVVKIVLEHRKKSERTIQISQFSSPTIL